MLPYLFFNDTSTTDYYTYGHTLSVHDARPISDRESCLRRPLGRQSVAALFPRWRGRAAERAAVAPDRAVQSLFDRAAIGADHRQYRRASRLCVGRQRDRHAAALHDAARRRGEIGRATV